MISLSMRALAAAFAISVSAFAGRADAEPVSFTASDGIRVYGNFQKADGTPRGTILLFHMAGSNRGEYAPLAPVLNKAGFATLAIDQRSGDTLWGQANQTVAGTSKDYDFADVLPDLEAAIAYGKMQKSGPIAIWGSSYSSALVFVVAARHPEVKALLAFSPAEYIRGLSIAEAASRLKIPVFITSAPNSDEIASAKLLAAAVPNGLAEQYIPKHGVHGSSTLRSDRNPSGAKENWAAVMAFLNKALPAK